MYLFAVDSVATAQADFDAGRFSEARVRLESRLADARAQALLARVYSGLKMPDRAANAARAAERLGSANPDVQHTLALYYAQSGQRKLAAEWESRFALSDAADPAAPLRAALLFGETEQWADAIRFGERALAKQDRPELRSLLARAYEAQSKPDDAIAQHRALVQQRPGDEPTHAAFGQALLRMARFNEAAALLEESTKEFPSSAQLELALGVAWYAQRRFADAGGRFLRVIELAPEVPQPYIFLARMMDQIPGRVPAIRDRAEAWYRAEHKNGFAPFVYAKALKASGAPDDETKPLILEAIRRDKNVWEFPFELGQLLERRRDFAGAARHYESAIAVNAQVPELHYRLARVYDRLGQTAKAERERALHKKLLDGKPGTEGMQ